MRPLRSGNPFFRGNVFINNTRNGMEVLPPLQNVFGYTPNLTVDSVWDDWDVPYILRGDHPAGRRSGFRRPDPI